MPADSYDVYVRLGQQNDSELSTLYFQSFSGSGGCRLVGKALTSGQHWIKVGAIQSHGEDGFGTFTLASNAINSLPGANRPTVMLVSQTDPVCQPTTECYVSISGQEARLRATGTLLNEDSLHVVTAKDPAKDTIKSVNYYVDNKLAYSTATVQPFDLRYVSGGKHSIVTVVDYNSKQQAVIQKEIIRSYYDDVTYYVFTFIHQQRYTLMFAGIALLVILLVQALVLIRSYFHRKKIWRESHFAKPVKDQLSSVTPRLHIIHPHKTESVIKRLILAAGLIFVSVAIVSMLNAWIIQLYQVDGPSMQTTLFTGNSIAVNKIPKTFNRLTRKQYVPKRGQVVVFIKERNVLFEPVEPDAPTYVVKRVIGLPGDRVVVNGAIITIYNSINPNGFNPDVNKSWTKNIQAGSNDQIDITLQPDELFLVGDNRPESIDSRSYGPVKLSELVGQANFRVTPISELKPL